MAERSLPHGPLTLLFTDIEGSTRRWEHRPEAMAVDLARHDALLRAVIEKHGGFVFKTIGDAFCAVFAEADAALVACLTAQRALAAEQWETEGPLRVRMALHSGEPERRERDFFGPPVNRVARLLATGYGEQVLLSQVTASLVRDRLPPSASLLDLGAHRLKDLLQPEHVFQLIVPDLPKEFPLLKSLDRQPHNLPAQPTALLGREAELGRLRELVASDGIKLVTLTGSGGTGKTRLALQAAADLLDLFPDGVWFVGLAPLTDPALAVTAIAQPLGVREVGHEPLEATLAEYLRDKQLLLVLDNFEHVLAAVPAVGRLLAACPKLTVLATSRAALRAYGEREVPVPPLPLPDLKRLPPPEELVAVPAVELFVERARAVKPEFALTAENATAVAGICIRVEGLPLAIELAAARARILPPAQLQERLSSRLGLLTGGSVDRDARQQTLRGAIAWSHDLLTPADRVLFRRLAAFAGGTFAAIEAVCAADGAADPFEGLESLVAQSLLRQEEAADGPRFFMLETIREFAAEQLMASGEEVAVRGTHANNFLVLAERAEHELIGPAQVEWLDRLEAEHDNLRAALGWLVEHGSPEEELRLVAALWRFWWARGHISEGRQWFDQVLSRDQDAPPLIRARARNGAGALAEFQRDLDLAAGWHEEALAFAREAGHQFEIARSLAYLGYVARARARPDEAVRLFQEALPLFRELGDKRAIATTLVNLSQMAIVQGDHVTAEELLGEALGIFRELQDIRNICIGLETSGRIQHERGDHQRAAQLYRDALEAGQSLGDKIFTADNLSNLARAVHLLGDPDEAALLFQEAISLYRELEYKDGLAWALCWLGRTVQVQGDLGQAWNLYLEALALYQQIAFRPGIADCIEGLAGVLALRGDATESVSLLAAAQADRDASGIPRSAAHRVEHEQDLEHARAALDDESYAAARSLGAVTTLEQAAREVAGLTRPQ
ncbi:MAG: ATP-binding protein [Thermomicrobiales bacterium]